MNNPFKNIHPLDTLARISPTRGVVFLLALGLLAWGLFLANPLVHTFASSPSFILMESVATESAWASGFIVGGFSMLCGVIRRDTFLLRNGAAFGFLLWLTVSIMLSVSNPATTGTVTYALLSSLHAWIYVQAKLRPETLARNVRVVALDDAYVDMPPGREPKNVRSMLD